MSVTVTPTVQAVTVTPTVQAVTVTPTEQAVTVTPTEQAVTVTPTVQAVTITTGSVMQVVPYSSLSDYAIATTLLATANAFYDIKSLNLTAGTWMVTAFCQAVTTSNAHELTIRLYDPLTSTEYGSSSTTGVRNTATICPNVTAIIVVASVATVSLQASSSGTSGLTVQYLTSSTSSTKCTGIIALQIA
jgi:hypothetical protein